jgi:hypothetical protein
MKRWPALANSWKELPGPDGVVHDAEEEVEAIGERVCEVYGMQVLVCSQQAVFELIQELRIAESV